MFSWLELAIWMLKLANAIVNWAHDRGMIDEGRRQVIKEFTLAIAAKVATKKQIQEHIDGLDDAQVDSELRDLEPR